MNVEVGQSALVRPPVPRPPRAGGPPLRAGYALVSSQATITRAGGAGCVAAASADRGPGGGEPVDGLLELVDGAGPGDPHEAVEAALGGEHRAGRRRSRRGARPRRSTAVPSGPGSSHHSASPPSGSRKRHSGSCSRIGRDERVAPLTQPGSRCAASTSSGVGRAAGPAPAAPAPAPRGRGRPGPAVSRSIRPCGAADPAQPQAAPEALAGAADRDRVGGVRRERARHLAARRSASAWCASSTTATVRVRRRWAAYSSRWLSRHQVAGGVLEVGDQVGQPGRGLPQRGGRRASRSQPSGSTGEPDEPGARRAASPGSRWGRPATRPAPGRREPVNACATIDAAPARRR